MSARFLRQVMLAEVGASGQLRIAAAVAHVGGSSLANEVASLYARGAGFGSVAPAAVDVDARAPTAVASITPAREVLAGARAALAEVRRALDLSPHPGAS